MASQFKSLPRLFIKNNFGVESIIADINQHHYVRKVLRLTNKDQIRLFNGKDGEWLCNISHQPKTTHFLPTQQIAKQAEDFATQGKIISHLCFSPLQRKERQRFLVESATSFGVSSLMPILTKRTSPIGEKVALDKLISHAIEASEQCGRLSIPLMHPIQSLENLDELKKYVEKNASFARGKIKLFVCHPGSQHCLQALQQCIENSPKGEKVHVFYFIGPEGGFEQGELQKLTKLGNELGNQNTNFVGFGSALMRAEVAAMHILSVTLAVNENLNSFK